MSERSVTIVVQGADTIDAVPGLSAAAARGDSVRFASSLAELRGALPGAEVLLGWDFKAEELEAAWGCAERLRWVHWSGAGVDALLFRELVASNVVVTNARGIFDRAMAEYVLGCVLALAKRLPETIRYQQRGEWRHRLSERIAGVPALVVGAGSIGRAIARLLGAAGMRVEGVGSRARAGDGDFARVFSVRALPEALGRAEYVVLVLPETEETVGLLDAEMIACMRPGARLVNVGRGSALDERAVLDALESGRLAGAALDVFGEEPLPVAHSFWSRSDVIVSPHMSGDFVGFEHDVAALFLRNLGRFRRGEPLLNVVDKGRGY